MIPFWENKFQYKLYELPGKNDYFSLKNPALHVPSCSPTAVIDLRYQIVCTLAVSSKKSAHLIDFPLKPVPFIPVVGWGYISVEVQPL